LQTLIFFGKINPGGSGFLLGFLRFWRFGGGKNVVKLW
jgi:hypothetical protein